MCRAQLLHREALQARTRRLHHATAATAALGPEADELPPPVQPPPTVHYSAEAANAVALCGTVLADPQVHRLPASQVVAHVRLALSAPASRPELAQQPQGAVTVDAWGSLALQLEAYVRKGSRIQVHGALREDRWRDRATSEWRRAVKVRCAGTRRCCVDCKVASCAAGACCLLHVLSRKQPASLPRAPGCG